MNTNSCSQQNNIPRDAPIIIIGAGWSGLACAITLIQQGHRICLLESARQVGGRARSIHIKGPMSKYSLDNGQHIMLGAYHCTRKIFNIIGINETEALIRQPVEFKLFSPDHPLVHLKTSRLPAPLHLLHALISLKGLSISERFQAIRFAITLASTGYLLTKDISVLDLLQQYSQPKILIDALWEPLCIATMNTPIKNASASVFLNVLKDSFNHKRQDSDLLFFKTDLSRLFSTPVLNFITNNNSDIHCECKVTGIKIINENKSTLPTYHIDTKKGRFISHAIVLATPAHISHKLLSKTFNSELKNPGNILLPATASLLFDYEPICTIYLQYPEYIKLPDNMVGFFNTLGQWAIDRSITNQPGLIAVVISGPGKHTQMSSDDLMSTIHNELSMCIPHLPSPLNHKMITEKKATFSCRVNIKNKRPLNQTNVNGLLIAGDYTDTNYPSTLEGAMKSGIKAAQCVIQYHNKTNPKI